jgi:N-acetylneuraminate synthase
LVIGEVAQAHDGSLGMAHAYIDAIAAAGADAVKFQTHMAAEESTPAEPWRVKFSRQDATRYEYWKRMEFTAEQWLGLKQHAEIRGLLFLSSPFSLAAADMLNRLGIAAWKIASGEVENLPLLEHIAATGKPVLLSSGMSSMSMLDVAVQRIQSVSAPLAVMQCTSEYPSPPERIGLNMLEELACRYDVPVGLSDHSGTIFPSLAAVTLGATIVEVHVVMSREMFGPDVCASVTTRELRQIVDGIRFIERALRHPVDKDALADGFTSLRQIFGKSIMLRECLPAGTRIERSHLTMKKPGTGLSAGRIEWVIGRKLAQAVSADVPLTEKMFQAGTTS